MAIQILGQDAASVLKIDATFDAARASLRPMEATAWQSIGARSGAATVIAANAAVFSLRNISSNLLIVRRVGVGFIATTGFTAAQQLNFGLKFARGFTASDTGGTAIALTANDTKVRTSLSPVTSVDCRISTTAALGAGTKTLDTTDLGTTGGWALAATAGVIIAPSLDNLFSHDTGDYPIVLAQNEGINVMNITTMGAAGVGTVYVNLEVAEATAY